MPIFPAFRACLPSYLVTAALFFNPMASFKNASDRKSPSYKAIDEASRPSTAVSAIISAIFFSLVEAPLAAAIAICFDCNKRFCLDSSAAFL